MSAAIAEDTYPVSTVPDLLRAFHAKVFQRQPPSPRPFHQEQYNERVPVQNGGYSPVYDPPRQSDFNTRASKHQIPLTLALQQYFAVMRDNFLYEKELEPQGAATPFGRQLPWRERENIGRPPAVAYGSMTILQPDDPYLTLRSVG